MKRRREGWRKKIYLILLDCVLSIFESAELSTGIKTQEIAISVI